MKSPTYISCKGLRCLQKDFQAKEVLRGMIQLTKWLFPTDEEIQFCDREQKRISSDPNRKCVIVYHAGRVAVYVDNVAGNAYDRLTEKNGI